MTGEMTRGRRSRGEIAIPTGHRAGVVQKPGNRRDPELEEAFAMRRRELEQLFAP